MFTDVKKINMRAISGPTAVHGSPFEKHSHRRVRIRNRCNEHDTDSLNRTLVGIPNASSHNSMDNSKNVPYHL
jgi:hypothetical protein